MNMIEVSAKTLDEAITKALIQLGTTSDNLEYTVIEKGSSGFLGLFGKDVKIRAKKKREDNDLEAFLTTGKIDNSSQEPTKEKKEPVKDIKKEAPKKNPPKSQKNSQKNQQKAVKEQAASEAKVESKVSAKPAAKSVEKTTEMLIEASTEKTTSTISQEMKEVEGFLNQVFGAMAMEVTLTCSFEEKERELTIDMAGADMGILIGKRGQTLDSLQYLTSLVVNKECDGYVRVKLDTENYRDRRKATLESLAKNIAYKVKRTRRNVSLEPMNPYERRIIHAALQNDRYVVTRSEGEEPFRHVVISLKREGRERERKDIGKRGHVQAKSQIEGQED